MTHRIYYTEPNRTSFEATVVSCTSVQHDGTTLGQSVGAEVILDQTAFYPTSGGQPFDIGTLGDARVLDVGERADGEIVHVVDRPLASGDRVEGHIDWVRRFDHMQQHTGQHLLSAAFDRVFHVRTESFHLGRDSSSIDLAREVNAQQIRAAEDEANRIVWEDRPVHIRFASAEEVSALPLRKESLRMGPLRLIEVEAFDLSACGGTHVSRTGAIGVIAIPGWEKFKGGSRVEFLCGGRALTRFREWRDVLTATGKHLSVPAPELAATVERLQGEMKSLQRVVRLQQEQLAAHEARALVARAQTMGERLVLVEALDGWDATGLKGLATAATTAASALAIALFSRTTPPTVVVAAGTGAGIDSAAVVKTLTGKFGGRGGGRRELAQAGGFTASLEDLLASAQTALTST